MSYQFLDKIHSFSRKKDFACDQGHPMESSEIDNGPPPLIPITQQPQPQQTQIWHRSVTETFRTVQNFEAWTSAMNFSQSEAGFNMLYQQQTVCQSVGSCAMPIEGLCGQTDQATQQENEYEDSRLQTLLDDPFILQELVANERYRTADNHIDLWGPGQHAFQVIALQRLHRIYFSLLVDIRLVNVTPKPIIVLVRTNEVDRIPYASCNVSEIPKGSLNVPAIATNLLMSLENAESSSEYVLLARNYLLQCWEVLGCLSPLNSFPSPPINCDATTWPPEPCADALLEPPVFINDTPKSDNATMAVEQQSSESMPEAMIKDLEHDSSSLTLPEEPSRPPSAADITEVVMKRYPMLAKLLEDIDSMSSPCATSSTFIQESESNEYKMDPTNNRDVGMVYTNSSYNKAEQGFECDICHKVLRNSRSLSVHKHIHDPSRLIHCLYCSYTNVRNDKMKLHVSRRHASTVPLVCTPDVQLVDTNAKDGGTENLDPQNSNSNFQRTENCQSYPECPDVESQVRF